MVRRGSISFTVLMVLQPIMILLFQNCSSIQPLKSQEAQKNNTVKRGSRESDRRVENNIGPGQLNRQVATSVIHDESLVRGCQYTHSKFCAE